MVYYSIKNNDSVAAVQLSHFADGSDVSDWAKGYVATLTKSGLVTGAPEGDSLVLNPQNPITRAEVAVVLERVMKL